MRRREFITVLGSSAAAWPLAAGAQQQPAMPVVGLLLDNSPERYAKSIVAFQQGLADGGFLVGQNVAVEIRSSNQFAKLPSLAEDLVNNQVAVIFASASRAPVLAAKAATTTIPIVFYYGGDPVRDGIVVSLSRPGGNLTGLTGLQRELAAKRLGLLHELVPSAKTIGLLTGTISLQVAREHRNDILAAAEALGLKVVIFEVVGRTLERAFATFVERQVGAVFVDNYPQLDSTSVASLAMRHKFPAMYFYSAPVRAGGLISYGTAVEAAYRQAAAQYVARILKGDKPTDLPVQQPTRFELVINAKTAKALGLEIPVTLLTIADEVIE
jgi:putative ABC transport system substrate-binding protein